VSLIAFVVFLALAVLPFPASAWNILGHMLSGIIAYQVLQQENPPTIEKVKAVLEKHPWYANQWQARFQDVPNAERDLMLFMQAARSPDDVHTQDKAQNKPSWHYINLPFKPEGQPASVQIRDPEPVNILTALAENESKVRNENNAERKAIAAANDLTSQRQINAKCCSLPHLARYLDPAAVVLDDPVTNRKAQSQTAFLFGSEKRLEKLRQVIIFDSKTSIRYANGYFLSHVLGFYRQSSSIRHCIGRIEIEIHQDLLNLPGVGINPW
jgi:hypothetical protein